MGHSTAKKDICYFANSEPDETLLFRLHERAEADGIGSIPANAAWRRTASAPTWARKINTST